MAALPKLSLNSDSSNKARSYDEEENDIHKEIKLVVKTADEKRIELVCSSGETIFNLKKRLHDEHQVDYGHEVQFNGKAMMDPLALADFPEIMEKEAAEVTLARS